METLAARVRQDGPLEAADAVGWAIRLAKRVEELHRLGVAHGGLSAACIFTDGRARTSRGELADVRSSPEMVAYHSPERLAGGGISQGDDTWAIGVALYFLLTGLLPFPGDRPADVLARISAGPARRLVECGVGDGALQDILDFFLGRDGAQRGRKVSSLRDALERWPGASDLSALRPLEEADTDEFGGTFEGDEDDDDDDEDNVATVMRDFDDIKKELDAMYAAEGRQPPAPPAGGTRPVSGAPAVPGGVPGVPPAPGGLPGVPPAPGMGPAGPPPAARPAGGRVGPPPMPGKPATGMAKPAVPPPGPLPAKGPPASQPAPPDDDDDVDAEADLATIVMAGPAADEVAAAVKQAMGEHAPADGPPPGWPRPAAGAPPERPAPGPPLQPPAAGQPPGAPPGAPTELLTVGGLLGDAAPQPPAPPDSGPPPIPSIPSFEDFGRMPRGPVSDSTPAVGPGDVMPLDPVPPAPGQPPGFGAAPGGIVGSIGAPGAAQPPGVGPSLPASGSLSARPLPGSPSMRPPPAAGGAPADLGLPMEIAQPPDKLRTWLGVAIIVLAVVLALVGLLWLRRQGIVEIW